MAKCLKPKNTIECKCGTIVRKEEMLEAKSQSSTSYWCPRCNRILLFLQNNDG